MITHYFPVVDVRCWIATDEANNGFFKGQDCFVSYALAKREYKRKLRQAIKMLEKEIQDLGEVQDD